MSKAITYSAFGGPEVLTLSEVPLPEPGPGRVRIRVRAVSVNPIEVRMRQGLMQAVFPSTFPAIPGRDVAGIVDAVGDGASAAVGDEVFGVALSGGYREHALLDHPVRKPAALSWEMAAAIVTVGEAAYRGLAHLDVAPGQTVLIHGGGGSVGTIAVQLAVARGATVIATVDPSDVDRVTAMGATAIPYGDGWVDRARAAAPQGVDAVLDASGAGVLADSVALTGDPAHVITIADPAAAQYGVRFTGTDPTDRFPQALPELAALAAAGNLSMPIWRTYPLGEAPLAHADIEARRNRGKITLRP